MSLVILLGMADYILYYTAEKARDQYRWAMEKITRNYTEQATVQRRREWT